MERAVPVESRAIRLISFGNGLSAYSCVLASLSREAPPINAVAAASGQRLRLPLRLCLLIIATRMASNFIRDDSAAITRLTESSFP